MKNNKINNSIYLIAPSGSINENILFDQYSQSFDNYGFNLNNLSCIDRKYQRFAGTDEDRIKEINGISNLDAGTIVLSARGGYGLSRLLPYIHWDSLKNAVEKGIKLVGHSDFTSLGIALFAKTNAISFAGPMLVPDFFSLNENQEHTVSEFTLNHFLAAINSKKIEINVRQKQKYLIEDLIINKNEKSTLWGGNLSILISLLGTEYFPKKNQIENGVLFIEDVNEHPYQIERMLIQLLNAGILGTQKAVLIGGFTNYKLGSNDSGYDLEVALSYVQDQIRLQGHNTVLINGLPFGHIKDKVTLPIGVPIKLYATNAGFTLEAEWI